MTHSIHLHFNLFSFPSPVFPLYFSLSSSCLFCALSEAASPSLFLPDSSRSCPRPIPLCSFLCYISLPLLSSVPFAPAISSLCPLSFSLCRHITLAAPISHPLSPETPSFQSSFPRQPLGVDIPLLFLWPTSPPSKQPMTPVAVAAFSHPQGTTAPSASPLPPLVLPSLLIACGQADIPSLCSLQPPWPEGSLAAQLMSWLICMQPATGLEGAPGSPKYPPWQPSDMNQARLQWENRGLCSHHPGAIAMHYRECLSKQPSFSSCLQGEDSPRDPHDHPKGVRRMGPGSSVSLNHQIREYCWLMGKGGL